MQFSEEKLEFIGILMQATQSDTLSASEFNTLKGFQNTVISALDEAKLIEDISSLLSNKAVPLSSEAVTELEYNLDNSMESFSHHAQLIDKIIDDKILNNLYLRTYLRLNKENRIAAQHSGAEITSPSNKKTKTATLLHLCIERISSNPIAIIMPIVAFILFLISSINNDPDLFVTPTPTPTVKPVESYLREIAFTNGQMVKRIPSGEGICPLTVSVSSGESYYIYFDCIGDSSKDFSFLVKPGRTVELDVPLGNYYMYYATGEKWYGSLFKFGEETRYYKADDIFDFTQDSEYVYGHTVELWKQVDGNLGETPINENAFPG